VISVLFVRLARRQCKTSAFGNLISLDKSIDHLEGMQDSRANHTEYDYFKFNPSYRADYFTNLPKLYESWQREFGLEGKKTPPGLRI